VTILLFVNKSEGNALIRVIVYGQRCSVSIVTNVIFISVQGEPLKKSKSIEEHR